MNKKYNTFTIETSNDIYHSYELYFDINKNTMSYYWTHNTTTHKSKDNFTQLKKIFESNDTVYINTLDYDIKEILIDTNTTKKEKCDLVMKYFSILNQLNENLCMFKNSLGDKGSYLEYLNSI